MELFDLKSKKNDKIRTESLAAVEIYDTAGKITGTIELTEEIQEEGRIHAQLYYDYVEKYSAKIKSPMKVVCPKGVLAVTSSISWCPKLAGMQNGLKFIEPSGGIPIRSCRRLAVTLNDLLSPLPDAVLLGPGMADWVIDLEYGQSRVDVHGFGTTLEWAVDLVCNRLRIPFLFLFSQPQGETIDLENNQCYSQAYAEPYYQVLVNLARRHQLFSVINTTTLLETDFSQYNPFQNDDASIAHVKSRASKLLLAEITKSLSELSEFRKDSPNASFSNELLESLPPYLPAGLSLVFKNGDRHRITDSYWVASLALSLVLDFSLLETGGIDEGASLAGKTMENVGGRKLAERWRQMMILLWIHQAHSSGLKRVMIIGDSIRMRLSDATGYGLFAYSHLMGKANLLHVPHNCGNTRVSLAHLTSWLSYKPDIVHINHGLHDCAIDPVTLKPTSTSNAPEIYRTNLHKIAETVLAANAKLIWCLCTPVDEEWHQSVPRSERKRRVYRRNADIRLYNDIACEVMSGYKVPVTDLFTPLAANGIRNFVQPDGVHLNYRGGALAGALVADAVKRCLT